MVTSTYAQGRTKEDQGQIVVSIQKRKVPVWDGFI